MKRVYESGDIQYGIHEVHYESDKVVGWTENTMDVALIQENENEDPAISVLKLLMTMQKAASKPILNYEDGKEL